MCSLLNVIKEVKSRSMKWTEHGGGKEFVKKLVEGTRKDATTWGLDSGGSESGSLADSCEYDNEPSGFMA